VSRPEIYPIKKLVGFDDDMLAAIEKWRAKQRPIPNLSDAIRDLISEGLAVASSNKPSRVALKSMRGITGAQIRAARGFLGWTIAQLATDAEVGLSTIQKIEAVDGEPTVTSLQWRSEARQEALDKIAAALEAAGITFTNGNEIRYRQ
jgi:hypothetical protein